MSDAVLLAEADGVASLVLNRPRQGNSLSAELVDHPTDLEIPFRPTPVTPQLLDRGLRKIGALLTCFSSNMDDGAGAFHTVLDSAAEHNRLPGRHRLKIHDPPTTQNGP